MFTVLGIFSFIPFNCFFLDPISKAIKDFDIYDVVYSKIREEPRADTNIVLINLSSLSRLDIARQIQTLSVYEPKLIAIDAMFEKLKTRFTDSVLAHALSKTKNLILVSKLAWFNNSNDDFDSLITSVEIFNKYAENGFANLPNDSKMGFRTIREFKPFAKSSEVESQSFAAKIVEIFNNRAYEFLKNRNRDLEIINYKGNYNKFYFLDALQVLDNEVNLEFIKDKIVLMGFMGTDLYHKTLEDIYFTPLNERFAGKTFPDMYGVVIHANIVSMILNKDYINEMPKWLSILLALIFSYISAFLIYNIKKKYKDWFGALTKIYILIMSLLNLFVGVMFYHHFNYKINLTLALAVLVLTNTIIEIYQTVISKLIPSLEKSN